jgi:hypothetical protein
MGNELLMHNREPVLTFNTRKALCVHLGDSAGKELADFLTHLSDRLGAVEQGKVDVIQIVPGSNLMSRKRAIRKAR